MSSCFEFGGSQRWQDGRVRYRPNHETIDPDRHMVAEIDEQTAKAFVCRHHYAASYPAARARFGLFRRDRGRSDILAGVAVFSVPMNQHAIPRYTGVAPNLGVELGRFVLLDEVEAMGETWFLARCARLLPHVLPEVRAVLSYSDPMPRRSVTGDLVKPGHIGLIYQAYNAVYAGRAAPRTLVFGRDGTVVSERTLTKLRNGERGASYAYEVLRRLGAPKIAPGESGQAYVRRALQEGAFCRLRHPGNHVYTFSVGDRRTRQRVRRSFPDHQPFPRAA